MKDMVPGVGKDTELIGVSRRGFTAGHGLDHVVDAADILAATAPDPSARRNQR